MYHPLIASKIDAIVDKFGINTDAFLAHLIAFTILVAIVVRFGIKPIMGQLEERKKRIEEGEKMRTESEQMLAKVEQDSVLILDEARNKGQAHIEQAKELASNAQEKATEQAAKEAASILENARKQSKLEAQLERDMLRQNFAHLVAEATANVTGKVLSDADHNRINEEAIKQL